MATGSIYLPNNYRAALGCESVVPAHVAETKAKAYVERTGKTIYVPGLGNFSPAGPSTESDKEPAPAKKSKARN
jgi:hypothetical protein